MANVMKKTVTIEHENGIHARIGAFIVQRIAKIEVQNHVKCYIQKQGEEKITLTSFLALVALKLREKDLVTIYVEGESAKKVIEEVSEVIGGRSFSHNEEELEKADVLLQSNALLADQIYNHMDNGLLVFDEKGIVTICNHSASKVIGLGLQDIIGKKSSELLRNSRIESVLKKQVPLLGVREKINHSVVVANITPIIEQKQCKGVVYLFEDISKMMKFYLKLKEVKVFKEKYEQILKSVQEGICFVDKNGIIDYVNDKYLKMSKQTEKETLGKNIYDLAPKGLRATVLKSGQGKIGCVRKQKDGSIIVVDVIPLKVEKQVTGVISVIRDITEISRLNQKLNRIEAKADYLEEELKRSKKLPNAFSHIIGKSGKMLDAMSMAAKAAESHYTVLIRGESGTGKELFAEAIHHCSKRANESFIRVNCAAIPQTLLESEFFGHEKGAFTGAIKTKLGKFELANKGTIFLDEIGEMEKSMQSKLLRVLQKREFQRVGGEKTLSVDVRIIAATNQDLEHLVKIGEFREDLYYRLNVIPLKLPPLRERKEDIPLLVEFLIDHISTEIEKENPFVEQQALQALMQYDWPGNVRELQNVLERTLALLESETIRLQDLPVYITQLPIEESKHKEKLSIDIEIQEDKELCTWEEYEKKIIGLALKKYKSYNAAAKVLGLTHKTVANKAAKYGFKKQVSWEKRTD